MQIFNESNQQRDMIHMSFFLFFVVFVFLCSFRRNMKHAFLIAFVLSTYHVVYVRFRDGFLSNLCSQCLISYASLKKVLQNIA